MLKKIFLTTVFLAVASAAFLLFSDFPINFSQEKNEDRISAENNATPDASQIGTPTSSPPDIKDTEETATSTEEKPAEPVKEEIKEPVIVPAQDALLSVPFTSQAPFGEWKDERQQDGCEEASAVMAMSWVKGSALSKEDALKQILAIADFENEKYGNYKDTSAKDTVKIIFNEYFKYDNVAVEDEVTAESIRGELDKGNLVIVPADGRKLNNPYYTQPGPERHNLIIKGYESKTGEFITNDPGTRRGENYRYNYQVMLDAIIDYPTGNHLPIKEIKKAMIIVYPDK